MLLEIGRYKENEHDFNNAEFRLELIHRICSKNKPSLDLIKKLSGGNEIESYDQSLLIANYFETNNTEDIAKRKEVKVIEKISLPTSSNGRYFMPSDDLNDVSDIHVDIGDNRRYFGNSVKQFTNTFYTGHCDPNIFEGRILYPIIHPASSNDPKSKMAVQFIVPDSEKLIMDVGAVRYGTTNSPFSKKTRFGWQHVLFFPDEIPQNLEKYLPVTQLAEQQEPWNLIGFTQRDTPNIKIDGKIMDYSLRHFFPNKEDLMLIPIMLSTYRKYFNQRDSNNSKLMSPFIESPNTNITTNTAAIEIITRILKQNILFAPVDRVLSLRHTITRKYEPVTDDIANIRIVFRATSITESFNKLHEFLQNLDLDMPVNDAMSKLEDFYKSS